MNIADALKRYRSAAGLTQEQVAKRLFVKKNTYSQYETGKRGVDAQTFLKLMDIFGVRVDLEKPLPANSDAKSLVAYKDDSRFPPRFQIELHDYHPIDQTRLSLEMVEGSGEWLDAKSAFIALQDAKERHAVSKIEWMTYESFDFEDWKKTRLKSGQEAFGAAYLYRVLRKAVEEKKGAVPHFDVEIDPEDGTILFLIGEDDEFAESVFEEELEALGNQFERDMAAHIFRHWLGKRIAKTIHDEDASVVHLFFK